MRRVTTIRWRWRLVALAVLTLAGAVWANRRVRPLPVVATAVVGPNALPLVVDTVHGRAFVGSSVVVAGSVLAGTVAVLDTTSGRVLQTHSLPAPTEPLPANLLIDTPPIVAGDGGQTFVLGQANGEAPGAILALDARTGRPLVGARLPAGGPDAWLAVDAQTHRLFVLALQFPTVYVSVYDARTLRHLGDTTVDSPAFVATPWHVLGVPIAVDARTDRVFVSFAASNSIGVLDAHAGTLLTTTALHPLSNTTGGAVIVNTPVVDERAGRVYVTDSASGTVNTLDATSGRLLCSVGVGPAASPPIVDERSGHIFVVHASGLTMLAARSGRRLRTTPLRLALASEGAAVDARTGDLYLADPASGLLRVFDGTSGRLRTSLDLGQAPTAIVVDGLHRRALLFTTATAETGAPWSWAPDWLRGRVPFLPSRSAVTSGSTRVTVLDTAHL